MTGLVSAEAGCGASSDHGWMTSHLSAGQNCPRNAHSPSHLTTRLPVCPTGSDQWKMSERKLFNKGIAIYKKDFFLVQKLVSWGSVSGAFEGKSCLQDLGLPLPWGPAVAYQALLKST